MSKVNIVEEIDDRIKVKNVIISVSDKDGLPEFVDRLITINPDVRIFSTGGTFQGIKEALGPKRASRILRSVSEYTGQPEMQGGLVKTLDYKIYLGILSETYNPSHQEDLSRLSALPVDMVVVNLYPFEKTIAEEGSTPEAARANIDIGGPCMIRAAAKNFIRVASVVDPKDYSMVLDEMREGEGTVGLSLRYYLARKAFAHTAGYDRVIAEYLENKSIEDVKDAYPQIRN